MKVDLVVEISFNFKYTDLIFGVINSGRGR